MTVPLFGAARVRARELDEHLARTGSTVGLLHGLPVSLKDCFVTPPAPSSVGFVAWANEETGREEESLVARLVGELGGVVFVKTAVPVGMVSILQFSPFAWRGCVWFGPLVLALGVNVFFADVGGVQMMMETTNRLYGPTLNPFNRSLSAGGSSGGEAALLAMRGSPLGVGTDSRSPCGSSPLPVICSGDDVALALVRVFRTGKLTRASVQSAAQYAYPPTSPISTPSNHHQVGFRPGTPALASRAMNS